jgi:hypothetical protein
LIFSSPWWLESGQIKRDFSFQKTLGLIRRLPQLQKKNKSPDTQALTKWAKPNSS